MTAEHRPMNPLEWSILLILAAVWGGSFFFNAIAVRDLPPMTFVVLRVAIAAAALFVAIKARGIPLPQGRAAWTVGFGMGLLNCAIPFSLIVWGQTRIDSGVAAILNATTPLFTVLVAHAFTRDEKLSVNKVLGVLAGIAGVAVMIGPETLGGLTEQVPAQLAVVGAAVCYGFAAVLGRKYARLGVRPMAAGFSQLLCATVVMAPLALFFDRPWTLEPPGLAAWGAVLAIALVSTAMAYALLFRLLATAGATNTSLVTLLVPVSAVLLGVLVLGERLEGTAVAGMGLIALGLALSDGRLVGLIRGRGRRLRDAGPPPLPGDRPAA